MVAKKKKRGSDPIPLDDVLEQIAAKTKGVKFRPADEVVTSYSLRRRFGIPRLDIGLRGGIPAGTLNQLFGPEGSGKDYLANRMIAEVQEAYGDEAAIFIASFGYKLDRTAMLMAGVHMEPSEDLASLGITPDDPQYKDQLVPKGKIINLELKEMTDEKHPAEAILEAVLACVECGRFQLGIINELPAAETGYHKQSSLLDTTRPAALASLMADFQRKFYNAMKVLPNNETTVMVINQVRANMSATGPYAKKTSETGGFALKHLKAADIHIRPIGTLKEGPTVIGKDIGWKVQKGKCGLSEGAEGSFNFLYYMGADLIRDLVDAAVEYNLILRKGAYYYFGDQSFQGLNGLREYLSDKDIYDQLYTAVLAAAGLASIRYK